MTDRQPFSKVAVAGLVLSCISTVVFGALGVIGAILCLRALGPIRAQGLRGRGLAIAGIIIGVLNFAFYAINFFVTGK